MAKSPPPVAIRRAMTGMGEHVAVWRRLRNLTAAELADRAGVSVDTVLRLERGESVGMENFLRVARALDLMEQLVRALDPYESDVGRLRADERLPLRVRHPRGERP